MQPSVEREGLLTDKLVGGGSALAVKDQVPAVCRHRTWNGHKQVVGEQLVAKRLLPSDWDAGNEPVWVGYVGPTHDMDQGGIKNLRCRQHMRHGIQCLEALVHGDLEDCCRRIERAIDDASTFAVPTSANAIGTFTAIPSSGEISHVETPREKTSAPKRWGEGGHA